MSIMIGIGISPSLGKGGGVVPFRANFAGNVATVENQPVSLASVVDYARSGGDVWFSDLAGDWSAFAADVMPRTDRGAVFEIAGQNHIRDVIPVAPGTSKPTNWSIASPTANGITLTYTGIIVIDGVSMQRLRYAGTTSGAGGLNLRMESTTQIVAANGETWAPTMMVALLSSVTNVNQIRINVDERTAAGASVTTKFGTANLKSLLTGDAQRFGLGGLDSVAGVTLTGGVTVERTNALFEVNWSGAGLAIDMEVAIGLPTMEKAAQASFTPFVGTRGAPTATLALPGALGPFNLTYTFDDLSTQVIADVPGGDYAIDPATLNRPLVTVADWRAL